MEIIAFCFYLGPPYMYFLTAGKLTVYKKIQYSIADSLILTVSFLCCNESWDFYRKAYGMTQYWMPEGKHSSSIITSVAWFHNSGYDLSRQRQKKK